ASSLAALDTAVKGLLFGDYDAVLAGGADRSMDPAVFIKFSKIGALSAKKSCPFDAEADGFVMGEGAGFVVLKRLSDAIRDNDKIYAVIRGIGSSSDGRGKGITAPNPQGQQNAILRAYNAAKISIDDIQYIECHGTSTVIGDAAELKVLQDILKNKGGNQKIAIGSVKSQIGHLKSAAAIAALIKTSLALYHKTIPPSVNFNTPNPKIDWEKAPFYVNTQTQPWELSESSIRRAGVSAFGFGGTNFHVVLEEYSPQNLDFPKISLPVYHLNENFPSLSQPINNFSEINEDLSLVLMFSGQGSQFVGMGKELYQKIPVIREVLDQANNISQNFGNFDLLKIMFGDPKRSLEENQKILTQTQFTQPAIFSLEIALYRYLTQKGLSPGIVAGHSLGEYSALVASGVIDFEHAMKAVIIRGKAMSEASSEISCGMAALLCSPEQAGKIISQINKGFVSISNYNSPRQTVISGDLEGINETLKLCQTAKITAIQLKVSQAFHSKFVAGAGSKLAEFLNSIPFKAPRIPIFSNVLGSQYPQDPQRIKDILVDQITSPVRWTQEIEQIYNKGGRRFVEVGPKKALFYFANEILRKEKNTKYWFTLSPKNPEVEHLQQTIESVLKEENKILKKKNYRIDASFTSQAFDSRRGNPSKSPLSILESDKELKKIINQPNFADFIRHQKDILIPLLKSNFKQYNKIQVLEQQQRLKHESLNKISSIPLGITGVGIGLPGKNRKVFDDSNIQAILRGDNFIEPIDERLKYDILEKNIVRLNKTSTGRASFIEINDISQVIHLAGQIGEFSPEKDFLLNEKLLHALDITSKLAIGAGFEALRDAGIPLVKSELITSTGKKISGDWALPEELQKNTGVVFASAFPGYDNFAKDLTTQLTQKFENQTKNLIISKVNQLLEKIEHPVIKKDLRKWFEKEKQLLTGKQQDLQKFNKSFLFRILSMGHSQFAQIIKAKGPNTQINAACATTTQAFAIAEDWIKTGRCNRVIIISGDCPTTNDLFPWLGAGFVASGAGTIKQTLEEAALPFGKGRNGLIAGAGATGFVVEHPSEAKRRGIKPIVDLLGTHISNSAYHGSRLDKHDICSAMELFISKMENTYGISKSEIAQQGMFVSHETYTPARGGSSESELEALAFTFGSQSHNILIVNTKGFTGHTMGVGIEEAVAIKSIEFGQIPPIANIEKLDPKFEGFNFSRGVQDRKKYAIRFAAGFGSQLAILLFRTNTPVNRKDNIKYKSWLNSIARSTELYLDGRILKIKSTKASREFQKKAIKFSSLNVQEKNLPVLPFLLEIISKTTGYDVSDLDSKYDLEEDLGIDTIKQAEIFGQIREKWQIPENMDVNLADFKTIEDIVSFISKFKNIDSETSETSQVVNQISSPKTEIESIETSVQKIIAEITGYDVEDLELGFDLEEDLGIDTIKQAEILGQIREKWQISENTEVNLADFRKIKDIVSFISKLKNLDNESSEMTQVIDQNSSSKNGIDSIETSIQKIISEITGYDVEDLELGFDLEEDLGIDTIKQAEIFGQIREKWQIPENAEVNLADFRTIKDIVSFISKLKNLDDESSKTTQVINQNSSSKNGIKSIETSIQKIISEITGYNVEDLELGFDLEEDLGIDTIKQAEIFGQIREKWQIPENVEVNLADFRTIEDIVRIIRSLEKPSKNAFSSNSEDISHDFQYLENIEEDSENNISIFSLKSILLEKPSEREENEEIYKRPLVLIEFNDHSHLNDKVQEVLQSRQIKIIPVILNTEYNSDEIKRFTENIKEKHHVDAITLGIITPALEQEDYFQSSESILMVLFHFLKALNPAIIQSCFILSNETILSSTDISNPVSSGISGFLKSLGKEFKFEFRHIYFYDVKDAISELLYQETLSEIIYNKEGLRHTIDRVKILPTDNAKSINIEENDLVLVTGGARGITFECIDKWTNSVHPSLILIGRTPYDSSLESYLHYTEEQLTNLKKQKIRYLKKHNPSITPVQVQKEWKKFLNQLELIKNLRKLRNKGIQVEYYDCDVTDYDKMAEIYEKIKN
ncbi:MAG: hypothetical protein DRO88_12145, partial [Promethearchaeia archaeon]